MNLFFAVYRQKYAKVLQTVPIIIDPSRGTVKPL